MAKLVLSAQGIFKTGLCLFFILTAEYYFIEEVTKTANRQIKTAFNY